MTSDIEKKEEIPEHIKLLSITDRYLVDLECLRDMFSAVMPVLQDQDKQRKAAVAEVFSRAKKTSENNENTEGDDQEASEEDKSQRIKLTNGGRAALSI